MSSRRVARLAEAIRETVSSAVLFSLRDPRIKNVTVIRAEVTPDLRGAKVYVSIMGSERDKALSLQNGTNPMRFTEIQIVIEFRLLVRQCLILCSMKKRPIRCLKPLAFLTNWRQNEWLLARRLADFERSTSRPEEPFSEAGDDA